MCAGLIELPKSSTSVRGLQATPERHVFLTHLLSNRVLSFLLAAAGTGQVVAGVWHLPGMPCPVARLFGIPCPGCGASRACGALLRGHWREAFWLHAFAPMFLLSVGLFWAAVLFPRRARIKLTQSMERLESRTAIPTLLLVVVVLYWLLRLLYAPSTLIHVLAS